MNQGTNLGSQIGRWIVLAAVVALLGALLLTIRPVGAQDVPPVLDPTKPRTIEVFENSVDVSEFTANDPDTEDKKIFWTLGGTDAAAFRIDRIDNEAALKFKKAPDFENPRDGDGDNVYEVTVRFGSGGERGEPGDTNYIGNDLDKIEVTVNVRNEDEPGMMVISPLQPPGRHRPDGNPHRRGRS